MESNVSNSELLRQSTKIDQSFLLVDQSTIESENIHHNAEVTQDGYRDAASDYSLNTLQSKVFNSVQQVKTRVQNMIAGSNDYDNSNDQYSLENKNKTYHNEQQDQQNLLDFMAYDQNNVRFILHVDDSIKHMDLMHLQLIWKISQSESYGKKYEFKQISQHFQNFKYVDVSRKYIEENQIGMYKIICSKSNPPGVYLRNHVVLESEKSKKLIKNGIITNEIFVLVIKQDNNLFSKTINIKNIVNSLKDFYGLIFDMLMQDFDMTLVVKLTRSILQKLQERKQLKLQQMGQYFEDRLTSEQQKSKAFICYFKLLGIFHKQLVQMNVKNIKEIIKLVNITDDEYLYIKQNYFYENCQQQHDQLIIEGLQLIFQQHPLIELHFIDIENFQPLPQVMQKLPKSLNTQELEQLSSIVYYLLFSNKFENYPLLFNFFLTYVTEIQQIFTIDSLILQNETFQQIFDDKIQRLKILKFKHKHDFISNNKLYIEWIINNITNIMKESYFRRFFKVEIQQLYIDSKLPQQYMGNMFDWPEVMSMNILILQVKHSQNINPDKIFTLLTQIFDTVNSDELIQEDLEILIKSMYEKQINKLDTLVQIGNIYIGILDQLRNLFNLKNVSSKYGYFRFDKLLFEIKSSTSKRMESLWSQNFFNQLKQYFNSNLFNLENDTQQNSVYYKNYLNNQTSQQTFFKCVVDITEEYIYKYEKSHSLSFLLKFINPDIQTTNKDGFYDFYRRILRTIIQRNKIESFVDFSKDKDWIKIIQNYYNCPYDQGLTIKHMLSELKQKVEQGTLQLNQLEIISNNDQQYYENFCQLAKIASIESILPTIQELRKTLINLNNIKTQCLDFIKLVKSLNEYSSYNFDSIEQQIQQISKVSAEQASLNDKDTLINKLTKFDSIQAVSLLSKSYVFKQLCNNYFDGSQSLRYNFINQQHSLSSSSSRQIEELMKIDNQIQQHVIKDKLQELLSKIYSCPTQQLKISDIQIFISNSNTVQNELSILEAYYKTINDGKQEEIPKEFKVNLQNYEKVAKNITMLRDLLQFEFLIEIYNSQVIKEQIAKISDLLKSYEQYELENGNFQDGSSCYQKLVPVIIEFENQKINKDTFNLLIQTKEMIIYFYKNKEVDFNELYDLLDDQKILNDQIFAYINMFKNFYNGIYQDILQKSDSNIYQVIKKYVDKLDTKESSFKDTLKQCKSRLEDIDQYIHKAIRNNENTLQVIQQILTDGVINFNFKNDVCCLSIKYDDERKEIENEDINSYSRKAILMSPQYSLLQDADLSQQKQKMIKEFANIIIKSQSICQMFTYLYQNSHEGTQFGALYSVQIQKDASITVSNLKEQYELLAQQAQQWREELLQLKQEYFVLTYIPNSKLQALREFLYFNDEIVQYNQDLSDLLQLICNATIKDFQEYMSRQNMIEKLTLNDIIKVLQEFFNEKAVIKHIQNPEVQDYESSQHNQVNNSQLKNKELHMYSVNSSLNLMRALASIYFVRDQVPHVSQILFCNDKTKLHEIESFIIRALYSPLCLQNSQLAYVIANFNFLNYKIQKQSLAFYHSLKKKLDKDQNQSHQKDAFYLYILLNTQQKSYSIEELQDCSNFNDHYLNDALLQKFYSIFKVQIFTSTHAGLGKSLKIRQLQDRNSKMIRIPIQGEIQKSKLIELHKQKFTEQQVNESDSLQIHYDIYLTKDEDLNIILFDLLIFKCIIDEYSGIFFIPKQTTFYLELSQDVKVKINESYFIKYINNKTELQWDKSQIIIEQHARSPIQVTCRTLNYLQNKSKDFDSLKRQNDYLSKSEAQTIIVKCILDKIKNPNYYILESYYKFAADQINNLFQNQFFNNKSLQLTLGDDGQILINELLNNMLTFTKQYINNNQEMVEKQFIALDLDDKKEILSDQTFFKCFIVVDSKFGQIIPIFKNKQELSDIVIKYFNYMKMLIKRDQETGITKFFYNVTDFLFKSSEQLENEQNLVTKTNYEQNISNAEYYDRYLTSFNELQVEEILRKLFQICGKKFPPETNEGTQSFNYNRIVITADNFLKICLIFSRLRSKQSVILLGETGIGKTVLIEYLKDILQWNYTKLDIHEGTTESQIVNLITQANNKAKGIRVNPQDQNKIQKKNKIYLIFLDEINTNFIVSGLVKEIITDQSIQGEKLSENIRIVAACNPYKQIQLKQQQVNKPDCGLIHKNQMQSELVYRVYPLPESFFPFTLNFGSLNENDTKMYITKIIHGMSKYNKMGLKDKDINYIVELIQASQEFIKSYENAQWAVSLRDVDRFSKIFKFFNKKHQNDLKKVVVLSLTLCYMFKISSQSKRQDYINQLLKISKEGVTIQLNKENFQYYLDQEANYYIDGMEIPKGIGISQSFKENVLAIIIMILNKIPLYIIGKPGNSKTLALNLVINAMIGEHESKSFVFKKLPEIISFHYQGSQQSTSKGIEKIFDKAYAAYNRQNKQSQQEELKEYEKNKLLVKNQIALVVIDEIGLAEKSPNNPLKVLHSYLEQFKVAFVGISNWSLDASKKNRGLVLSKKDPDLNDLLKISESIYCEILEVNTVNTKHKEQFQKLAQFYHTYYSSPGLNDFHGLRDYYQMISYICYQMSSKTDLDQNLIIESIQRNFSGNNLEQVFRVYKQCFNIEEDIQQLDTKYLITQNIKDKFARNLMIISEHNEQLNAIFIENICLQLNRKYKTFYGSNFQLDKAEEAQYEIIHEIIQCMESGLICIFFNLNKIYEAFYDMLNQNYQCMDTKSYCKVAIGPDFCKCSVHPDFRCILLTSSNAVTYMDPPLLNRFEKHQYNLHSNLNNEQLIQKDKLQQWIVSLLSQDYQQEAHLKTMFPVLYQNSTQFQSTLVSLIDMASSLGLGQDEQAILEFCKVQLIQFSNKINIVRLQYDAENQINHKYCEQYNEEQHHNDLPSLICYYSQHYREDKMLQNLTTGFNLVVYSYSTTLNVKQINKQFQSRNLKADEDVIYLSSIPSKQELQEQLENFFENANNQICTKLILADQQQDTYQNLQLCKNMINQIRHNLSQRNENQIEKNIIIGIRMRENQNSNICFSMNWKELFLDCLNGSFQSNINQSLFQNNSVREILEDVKTFRELLFNSLSKALAKIKYVNLKDSQISERLLEIIRFTKNANAQTSIQTSILNIIEQTSFKQKIDLKMKDLLFENQKNCNPLHTYHSINLDYLESLLSDHLAYMFYKLEKYQLLTNLLQNNKQEIYEKVFEHYLKQLEKEKFKEQTSVIQLRTSYLLRLNYENISKEQYPFFNQIFKQFEIIYNSSQQSQEYNHFEIELSRKYTEVIQKAESDNQVAEILTQLKTKQNLYIGQLMQKYDYKKQQLFGDKNQFLLQINQKFVSNLEQSLFKQVLELIIKGNLNDFSEFTFYIVWKLYSNFILDINEILSQFQTIIQLDQFFDFIKRFITESISDENSFEVIGNIQCVPKVILYQSLVKTMLNIFKPTEQIYEIMNGVQSKYSDVLSQVEHAMSRMTYYGTYQEISIIKFYYRFQSQVIDNIENSNNILLLITQKNLDLTNPIVVCDEIHNTFIEPPEDEQNEQQLTHAENPDIQNYIVKFILLYLDEQYEKAKEIDIEQFMDFIINIFDKYREFIPIEPLIAKGLIQKLTYHIVGSNLKQFIYEALTDYDNLLSNNTALSQINSIVQEFLDVFDTENAILVMLSDQLTLLMQEQINELQELITDEQFIKKQLDFVVAKDGKLNEQIMIRRIIALSFSKVQLTLVSRTISAYIKTNEQFSYTGLIKIYDQYFSRNKNKTQHLVIYLFKLIQVEINLVQCIEFFQKFNRQDSNIFSWIVKFEKITHQKQQICKYYINYERQQEMQNLLQKSYHSFQETLLPQASQDQNYNRRLQVLLTLLQESLNNDQQNKDYMLNIQSNFLDKLKSLSFQTNQVVNNILNQKFTQIQKKYLIKNKSTQMQDLLLYTIMTCASMDKNCFFRLLFENPLNTKDIYIPFQLNSPNQLHYQFYQEILDEKLDSLKDQQLFAVYKCNRCNQYLNYFSQNIIDKVKGSGLDTQCFKCKNKIGKEYIGNITLYEKNTIFRLNQISVQEDQYYVSLNFDDYNNSMYPKFKLRKLEKISLIIGQILLNLIVMSSFLLSHKDSLSPTLLIVSDLLKKIWYDNKLEKNEKNNNFASADENAKVYCKIMQQNIIKYLNQLKQELSINDTKVSQLIQKVLSKINSESSNRDLFHENLNTEQGRFHFEEFFQKEIVATLNPNQINQFFKDNKIYQETKDPEVDEILQLLEENKQIETDDEEITATLKAKMFPSMLRIQGEINMERFVQSIELVEDKREYQIIKIVIQKLKTIETIYHLHHMIQWMHFVMHNFDGKIGFDEAEYTITHFLNTRNHMAKQKGMQLFENFRKSWNYLSKAIDFNDNITMDDSQKFKYCCITNYKENSPGYQFFKLIMFAAQIQNKFLEQLSQVQGYPIIQKQIEHSIQLKDLNMSHLITEYVDNNYLLDEIKKVSQNSIKYSEGKNIEYNIQILSDKLLQVLVYNKAHISFNDKIDFNYLSLNNTMTMYQEIQLKIKQVKYRGHYEAILRQITSDIERYELLLNLQATATYLQQLGGNCEDSLSSFMKAFQIEKYSNEIDQTLQLQHLLHFYEYVESSIETQLVQRYKPSLIQQLTHEQKKKLAELFQTQEFQVQFIKQIIARLIIRELYHDNERAREDTPLFEYLFGKKTYIDNKHLIGIGEEINQEKYYKHFKSCQINLQQAWDTFNTLKEIQLEAERAKNLEAIPQVKRAEEIPILDQRKEQSDNQQSSLAGQISGKNMDIDIDELVKNLKNNDDQKDDISRPMQPSKPETKPMAKVQGSRLQRKKV